MRRGGPSYRTRRLCLVGEQVAEEGFTASPWVGKSLKQILAVRRDRGKVRTTRGRIRGRAFPNIPEPTLGA